MPGSSTDSFSSSSAAHEPHHALLSPAHDALNAQGTHGSPDRTHRHLLKALNPPQPATPMGPSTVDSAASHLSPQAATHDDDTASAGVNLRIQTDLKPTYQYTSNSHPLAAGQALGDSGTAAAAPRASTEYAPPPKSPRRPPSRTPSFRQALANSLESASNHSLSSAPNSVVSSPMLNAMADVTPLPSPLLSADSPGPWRKLQARPVSRGSPKHVQSDAALVTANGESISAAILNQSKRRAYQGLASGAIDPTSGSVHEKLQGHGRNRSISEYVPEDVVVTRGRQITVSGSHIPLDDESKLDTHMRREPHLAVARGLASIPRPPTPPSSRTGGESSDSDSSVSAPLSKMKKPRYEYFEALTRGDSKRRRWRALKLLGEGTFSKVVLATSAPPQEDDRIDEDLQTTGIRNLDPKKLVAIKICEHGPKGGASEERVEMSLKRELDIMKSIHHPSVVHLKAWSIEETRAILVLSYSPGGDLFEVASEHRQLLVPSLLRRIFSELVAAVCYLHERRIVHRDIKLENVLVNLPADELAKDVNWATYEYPIITLTDLGLSRRVADDEKLTTRCGSDDYAAPEVIMGQPYDGRAVDAWSMGVLLYALIESRLPFDPTPGMSEAHKQRSRTSHRIARVEWRWVLYAGEDGDHEGDIKKFEEAGLKGAMEVTEGLLKRARSRWSVEKVAEQEWVRGGLRVENGLKFREEHIPEEVV